MKVGIIGAGWSGLITARELEALGHEVEIFEARDRIGGRTWTDDRWGIGMEMGGTWVHWMQPHVWAEIARYGAEIVSSPFTDRALWITGGEVREGTEEELDEKLGPIQAEIFSGSREFFPRPHQPRLVLEGDDEELKERFREADNTLVLSGLEDFSQEEIDLADSYWSAGYNGPTGTASKMMAKHWASLSDHRLSLLDDQTLRYKLKFGMRHMYEQIAENLSGPIHLSTPVTEVHHGEETYLVADGEKKSFDHIVCTIPVGALGNVSFTPDLPEPIREIVDEGWNCRGFKIWLRLEGHHNLMAYAPTGYPIALIRSEYFLDDGTTICVGFGPERDAIDLNSVEDAQAMVNQWDPSLKVLDATGHDWGNDEWTGQTWTTPKLGQFAMTGPQEIPGGRLHLAGSDWAAGWNSFVDGAIESGMTTARKIHNAGK